MNGKLLENVSHFDAVDALKAAGDTMHMVIKRDLDFNVSESVSAFSYLYYKLASIWIWFI